MSDLNPIINPQINLETPIALPTTKVNTTVDVGSALAGLVKTFASGSSSSSGPSANDIKNAKLSEFNQTIADWYQSDMSPTDFTNNVRGLAVEAMAAYPEYRTDIMGVVESVGVTKPTLPTTNEDAWNTQYNDYMNSNRGAADMLSAAVFVNGEIDEAATQTNMMVNFNRYLLEQAEQQKAADALLAAETDNKLYNELADKEVRKIAPNWATASNEALDGLFKLASQAGPEGNTPEEQIAAIIDMRRQLDLRFREDATARGITDPTKYEKELANALAPFDSLLTGLRQKGEAAESYLKAYNAMAEIKRTEEFVSFFGATKGTSPAFQEAFMNALATQAYTSGQIDEFFSAIENGQEFNLRGALDLFPSIPLNAQEGISTPANESMDSEVIGDLRAREKADEGFLEGQLRLSSALVLSQPSDNRDPQVVFDSLGKIVASSTAAEGPLSEDLLKSVLNDTSIRIYAEAAKGPNGQDIEGLLSSFAGEQLRRNKVYIDSLLTGLNASVEWRGNKLVVLQNGTPIPELVNTGGMPKALEEVIQATKNINLINNSLRRFGDAGKAANEYTGQMFSTGMEDIQNFLLQGGGGQAGMGGGEGTDTLGLAFIGSKNADTNLVNTAIRIAARYGIPEAIFLNQIGAESSWKMGQVSRAGAIGLGQLMPGTAAELGVDPTDPLQNLEGAARYLRQQKDRFGTWELALAAYNAGPGAVEKAGGIPDFKETKDYVNKILTAGQPEYFTQAYAPSTYKPQGIPTVKLNEGMSPLVSSLDGASSMTKEYAVDHMDFVLNGPFQRMQELFGGELVINDGIAKAGTSREKNTPGSQHFHGNALDISLVGMSEAEKLKVFQSALAAGFTGFGFGNNILHVDIGPKRSWDYGVSTFGGVAVSELQNQIAGGATPRLIVPTSWNKGADGDVGVWEPEYDPEEGAPQNFVPIQEQAPTESPRPAERPTEKAQDRPVATPEGGATQQQPTSSQRATQELSEQTKAMLQGQGLTGKPAQVQTYASEQEFEAALKRGEVKGGIVSVNGQLIMVDGANNG